MVWVIILGAVLLVSISDSALNPSAVFHVPANNFTLACILPKTSHGPSKREFTGTQSFLQALEEADYGINIYEVNRSSSNDAGLQNKDGVGCCFLNDMNNCFISSEQMETKSIKWNIMCWISGNQTRLICNLIPFYKMTYISAVFRIKYIIALVDISVEVTSLESQKNHLMTKQQNCSTQDHLECVISIINMNHIYLSWIEVTTSKGRLQSPPMLVNPTSIYKPYSPTNLKTEILNEGQLRISWTKPTPTPCELLYEVKYHKNSSQNIFQNEVNVLEPLLHIGIIQSGFSYFFQVRCKCHNGNGFWSNWSNPIYFNAQDVVYFPQRLLTSAGANVTVSCIYYHKNLTVPVRNIVWWLNLDEQVSETQYSVLNNYVASVTLLNLSTTNPEGKFHYHALYCCEKNNESIMCNHRYAELYVINVNLNFSCETNGNLTKMTCRWDISSLPDGSTLKLKYYRYKIYCSGLQNNHHYQEVDDCHLNGTTYYECIFTPIFSLSGYVLWLEIHHQLGILESPKSCIIPMDVVKPLPPSNVKAEITINNGYLNVTWERPSLPVDSLELQIRYSVNGTDTLWKMQNFLETELNQIEVLDPCAVYIVQVRCRRFNNTGYWSQWAEPAYTAIRDIRAPSRGPDFWRIITEDPIRKEKRVTLLWKPMAKEDALCTVKGIMVQHQTSQNDTWTDILENKSRWTFAWTEDVHTVTVSAFNTVGSSVVNFSLTFSSKSNAVYAAQSLEAYLVNATCVFLSWTVLPTENLPTCFIIEWKIPAEEDHVMWARVPSNLSRFYIFDHFVPINKYHFTLYPIFPEGEGHPVKTSVADKGNEKYESDTEPYIILLIIVLSTILLIGTILISQKKMRKLFWEDVPNPQNCSWAQGVNFEKPESFEELFVRHNKAFAFGPLLLEPEAISETFSIEKNANFEETKNLTAVQSTYRSSAETEHDSACFSSQFDSNGFCDKQHDNKAYPETSGSKVIYATVVNTIEQKELCKQQNNVNITSINENISVNNSDILGFFSNSLCDVEENQTFLQLTEIQFCETSKNILNSTISSEGFSEPSDEDDNDFDGNSAEKNICYLRNSSINEEEEKIFLKHGMKLPHHFQRKYLFKLAESPNDSSSSKCDSLLEIGLERNMTHKTIRTYMPQF